MATFRCPRSGTVGVADAAADPLRAGLAHSGDPASWRLASAGTTVSDDANASKARRHCVSVSVVIAPSQVSNNADSTTAHLAAYRNATRYQQQTR